MTGKVAIITGASTGIGKEIALKFAFSGYKVYLLARSRDSLDEICKEIQKSDGSAVCLPTDLSMISSIENAISEIKNSEASIDAIINVAGIWHGKDGLYAGIDFDKFRPEVIIDTYTVGLTAPSLLIHGLLPLMKSGSSIINISGTFADGGKGWAPYYISKRALEDLTVALAQDLSGRGIFVNCISPSDTATESYAKHFPQYIDDAQEPSEIANFTLELCKNHDSTGKVFVMRKGSEPFEQFHA